eukprot:2557591-Rhodomonas_salina.4
MEPVVVVFMPHARGPRHRASPRVQDVFHPEMDPVQLAQHLLSHGPLLGADRDGLPALHTDPVLSVPGSENKGPRGQSPDSPDGSCHSPKGHDAASHQTRNLRTQPQPWRGCGRTHHVIDGALNGEGAHNHAPRPRSQDRRSVIQAVSEQKGPEPVELACPDALAVLRGVVDV